MKLANQNYYNREAQQTLLLLNSKVRVSYTHWWDPEYGIGLVICNHDQHPFALLMQWVSGKDPLCILEWVFLPLQPKRTVTTQMEALAQLVMKGRHCVVEIVEMEPAFVVIPLVSEYLQWAIAGGTVGLSRTIKNALSPS